MNLAEDVKAMLTEHHKEVHLLWLTNGGRQIQRKKMEACACQSYFDTIAVSEEQKEKPVPSIFYLGCYLLTIHSVDCVIAGDVLETDRQGGLNTGLKATVCINRSGKCK
jgi:N-acylneuraminate-9-phosphatase